MNVLNTTSVSEPDYLNQALDNLPVAAIVFSAQARIRYANKKACQLLAAGDAESSNLPDATRAQNNQGLLSLTGQLSDDEAHSFYQACQNGKEHQLALTLQKGKGPHIQLHLRPVSTDSDDMVATVLDLSGHVAGSRLPVHFNQAMQQTDDMVMVTNSHGRIEYVNPAFVSQTGFKEEDVLGENPGLLSSGEHDDEFYSQMWKTLHSGQSFRTVFINRRLNGERYHEEKTITPIRDEYGHISHFVATGRDITDLINSEQRLDYLRRFDPLTGLPNRDRLAEQFELHTLQRKKEPMALLLLDLDRLSRINDSLGRSSGDELLKKIGQRLKKKLPEYFVGRLGSDAFLIMAEGIHGADQAAHMAQKLQRIMAQPFRLKQSELFMNVSLGITLYPEDGVQFDELINKADSAMHRSKDSDQGFGFFTEDLTLQMQSRVRLESQLRQALLHREFHLVFQPRVDLKTGRVNGAEALLRWIRQDGSTVSPAEFIPILEEMGLITSVGEWALLRACHYASQWLQRGHRLCISVNLSARQLRQPKLCEVITRCLELTGLPVELLELELTETSMLENVEHSIDQLARLKAMGIKIAVDDFGTGYSSLAYLKRLPVDTLKIDRAFIHELTSDNTDMDIVRAITQLAHSLKLSVTAEGVETPEQLALIQELGCNEGQGYLLARPMPEVELLQWSRHFNIKDYLPD